MPNSKITQRRGPEEEAKSCRGGMAKKASSFHGRSTPAPASVSTAQMTLHPDLTSWNAGVRSLDARPKLTKVLLKVTIQGSLGPVQVVLTPDSSVGDVAAAAVQHYVKEARRPILPTADPASYDLHYSQYTFECLDREEKVMNLGSRNFFLCGKRKATKGNDGGSRTASASSSCWNEADKASRMGLVPWPKFMDFLL